MVPEGIQPWESPSNIVSDAKWTIWIFITYSISSPSVWFVDLFTVLRDKRPSRTSNSDCSQVYSCCLKWVAKSVTDPVWCAETSCWNVSNVINTEIIVYWICSLWLWKTFFCCWARLYGLTWIAECVGLHKMSGKNAASKGRCNLHTLVYVDLLWPLKWTYDLLLSLWFGQLLFQMSSRGTIIIKKLKQLSNAMLSLRSLSWIWTSIRMDVKDLTFMVRSQASRSKRKSVMTRFLSGSTKSNKSLDLRHSWSWIHWTVIALGESIISKDCLPGWGTAIREWLTKWYLDFSMAQQTSFP
jgi:hypothetical protein